ncbi:MAG: hypothetical protein AB8B73_16135 [Ekhidna sp.]
MFSNIFTKKEIVDAGACPNCWGEQEYDNVVREMVLDKQIDVKNHEAKHSFIQDFVVNHVSGIHLQKGESGLQCQKCKRVA